MSLMHLWDQALMKVLPKYYQQDASPQTLFRIKKDILSEMKEHIAISKDDARHVKVQWLADEKSVNLVVPPKLLTQTLH